MVDIDSTLVTVPNFGYKHRRELARVVIPHTMQCFLSSRKDDPSSRL